MENLVNQAPALKKNYAFIDAIRCLSMMGIVFEHAATLWQVRYNSTFQTLIQVSAMQIFKFSTIAFFLIGGFLINYKFTEYTPFQYIKKRFTNTFRPWLIWLFILIALDFVNEIIIGAKFGNSALQYGVINYLGSDLYHSVFYTSFWFIPNFLICITLLLVFKKYLYKLWFGLFWLAVSLFYSINLYYRWIITEHSTALFGFVFYLWLGVYLNKHFSSVLTWINKTSYRLIISVTAGLLILACAETIFLMNRGSGDSFNTLRITNILYSLGMFILLLKVGDMKWFTKNLEPRKTTFGIYLIHEILIIHVVIHLIYKPFGYSPDNFSAAVNLLVSIGSFLIAYLVSLFITKGIVTTKAKWLVGQ